MNYLSICKHYYKEGDGLLRPMKMVYVTHGFFLGFTGRNPYIGEDSFQAWKLGPVLPDLYRDYASSEETHQYSFQDLMDNAQAIEGDDLKLVEWVKGRYEDKDAWELVELTHGAGTPWDTSYDKNRRGVVIKDSVIRQYYSKLVARITSAEG